MYAICYIISATQSPGENVALHVSRNLGNVAYQHFKNMLHINISKGRDISFILAAYHVCKKAQEHMNNVVK